MNDSANTPGPALIQEANLPEHFDWSALALPRSKSTAPATGATSIPSEHPIAPGDDRGSSQSTKVIEPDPQPGIELTFTTEDPAAPAAGAPDPMREARAARGDDPSVLSGLPAPEQSAAINQQPLAFAKLRHPPLPLPKDRILRLRFSDVGEPSEPGEHRSRFGLVEITRNDLAVWKAFPNAVFTVIQPSPYSNAMISRLGTFEV